MAQAGYTPISLYYSTTASAVPLAANLVPGELAININDGKLYYENSSGVVTLLASTSGASGDVVGPASATDNAIARFDLTTGKLIQNSVVTIADTTGNMAGVGTLSSGAITTTGVLTVTAGTVSLPAITTTGDTNTGIYFPAADTIAFTEGGVESMRITSAGDVGIGTTSPTFITGTGMEVSRTGGTAAIQATRTDASTAGGIAIQAGSGQNNLNSAGAKPLVFYTDSTDRMRIDATGNVGIGTSSPSYKLDVIGQASRLGSGSTGSVFGLVNNTGGNLFFGLDQSTGGGLAGGSSAYAGVLSHAGAYSLQFGTNNTIRATIDSSGNVGIGTATPSAQLQVAGSSSISALKVPNIEEVATISATAATGTIAYDITTQSVLYYTSNASANWTVNFRGSSGTSLNTLMATGESISVTFLVTQGATAYYNSSVQVDGTTSGVTTKWQGSAPTSGNASSIDSYTYVIIKTANATFTVLAAQTKFA